MSSFITRYKKKSLKKDDAFGYIGQGYMYGIADKSDFGGWIVINKSTGEWCTTEVPAEHEAKDAAVKNAESNITKLESNEPFKRCFSDVEEFFYKSNIFLPRQFPLVE